MLIYISSPYYFLSSHNITPRRTIPHSFYIFTLPSSNTTGCPRPVLTSKYSLDDVPEREDIEGVLELIRVSKPFPEAMLPGSVVRQREIVAELEEEFNMSAVNQVRVVALHCIVLNRIGSD